LNIERISPNGLDGICGRTFGDRLADSSFGLFGARRLAMFGHSQLASALVFLVNLAKLLKYIEQRRLYDSREKQSLVLENFVSELQQPA
jgi:hypothetical protein